MSAADSLPDLLHYTCSRCQHTWVALLNEEYGECDDDCSECGARHMSPVVLDIEPFAKAAPVMLRACETLKAAWDAGEETNDVEWEDLTVAVGFAEEALALVNPT